MEKIKQLVELQKETSGATFTLGFSTTRQKYYIQFNNKSMRIESEDLEKTIDLAINFVLGLRKEVLINQRFTLH